MSLKTRLAPLAARLERGVDRLWPQRPRSGPPVIDPYLGYSTPEELILRGRVLSHVTRHVPRHGQRWWRNLLQMISLFFTWEVSGVTVVAEAFGRTAVTDEEGYFTLHLPRREALAGGWNEVVVGLSTAVPNPGDMPRDWQHGGAVREAARLPVQVTRADAAFGVISDIDDTMMRTGAYSLWRNLWTSLTGNTLTREIFPDAVELMDRLSEQGRNPVFYVSSSPWNLHHFLNEIFERHGLVQGPLFLRDLGISETKFITGTHGDHKGDAIDSILAANPGLPFVLMGDTGQHDAQVYAAAAQRHPGQVAQVILRAPGKGADARDMAHVEALRERGVPVHVGTDYRALIDAHATPGVPEASGGAGEAAARDQARDGEAAAP